jgi:hypothetical protein
MNAESSLASDVPSAFCLAAGASNGPIVTADHAAGANIFGAPHLESGVSLIDSLLISEPIQLLEGVQLCDVT